MRSVPAQLFHVLFHPEHAVSFVQANFGFPSFRVLVVAKTEDRIRAIRALIARSTDKVFWLADIESIQRDGFWSPIWLRPTGDQRQPLQ